MNKKENKMITQMKKLKRKLSKANTKINLALLSLIAPVLSSADDFSTISAPLKILGKLIVMIIGLAYLVIGGLWIWLPILVIMLIKKHYDKKFEERGEENTKDMITKMIIGGLGAAIMSFVVIGVFGMIFFGNSGNNGAGATTLLTGIQAYYGNLIESIVKFITNNMGIGASNG